jgi:hypothetical protein
LLRIRENFSLISMTQICYGMSAISFDVLTASFDLMKHDALRSVAHNIATSLAGGIGLLIGVYDFDVFEDARKSQVGYITVDFLKGTTTGGKPSLKIRKVVRLYRDALPKLCQKHGVSISDFVVLNATYSGSLLRKTFSVTVQDLNGHQSVADYSSPDGSKIRVIDDQGRLRPTPVRRSKRTV